MSEKQEVKMATVEKKRWKREEETFLKKCLGSPCKVKKMLRTNNYAILHIRT